MSQLKKLRIQGFRSFGPEDTDGQIMDFESKDGVAGQSSTRVWPLTLILGQNGCGKTTIIECLRYLTTGDTPPGSYSGKSFVHDPKMANEHTVRASAKLVFRGTDGKDYMVTRAMEASQKTKTITVKTLDGTFTKRGSDGSNHSLSTKCADINAMVLTHLGVSKPILNYVIFCHQEDSNWPLEEGSKVKAKFDEIFASDKYQACLKNIKDVRTKHMNDQKFLKKDIEFFKGDKNMATAKKRDLEVKRATMAKIQKKVDSAEDELKPIRQELLQIRKMETNFMGIMKEQENANTRLEETQKNIEYFESNVKNRYNHLGKDGLKDLRRQKELEAEADEKKLRAAKEDLHRAKDLLGEDGKSITAEMAKIAECNAKKKAQEKKKSDLDEKVAMARETLNLGLTNLDQSVSDNDDAVETVLKKVISAVNKADNEARKTTQSMEAKIESQTKQLSKLEAEIAVSEEGLQKNKRELTNNKREIAVIKQKTRESQVSMEKLTELKDQKKEKDEKLTKLRNEVDLDDVKKEVEKKKREIRELESKEKILREEKAVLDEKQKELTDLKLKREDMSSKAKQLSRLKTRSQRRLETALDGDDVPDPGRLREEFVRARDDAARRRQALAEELSALRAEAKAADAKRRELEAVVREKRAELEGFDGRVAEAVVEGDGSSCGGGDSQGALRGALEAAREEIAKARDELSRKEANKFTFEEFINILTKSPEACPTCCRKFDKEYKVDDLKRELREEIERIPKSVSSIKDKIKRCVEKQERLLELNSQSQYFETTRAEVEAMESNIKKLNQESKSKERQVSPKEDELRELEDRCTACEEVQDDVLSMDSLHREVKDLEAKIADLEERSGGDNELRSLDEHRREEEATVQALSAARKAVEAGQQRELKVARETNQLEGERNRLQERILEVEKGQQEQVKLEAKRAELEAAVDGLNAEQKTLQDGLVSLKEARDEEAKTKNRLVKEKDNEVEKAQKKCNQVRKLQGELESLAQEVRDYNDGDNERRMADLVANLQDLKEKEERNKSHVERLEEEKTRLERSLGDFSSVAADIETNLKLLGLRDDERELKEEVKTLKARIRDMNADSTERRKRELETRYNELDSGRSHDMGRLQALKLQEEEIEKELSSEKLRLADAKYKEAYLSHRLEHHVINDLEKYHKALSYAISKFHKERMDVINRIIRELWRRTYKGNDIDYIEIKTDEVDPNAGIDKRRTINYKVVMRKNSTELEMRGRCSAGQKVLASLIIRLALAETFSEECGIIALDEPTTNLDRDNIESLADALASLVGDRRGNGDGGADNFQLIVITHDHDLIDALGRQVDDQRHYYKVKRNERGLSVIRKHNFDTYDM